MSAFLAVCVIGILAAWVWCLKHQLSEVEDRLVGAAGDRMCKKADTTTEMHRKPQSASTSEDQDRYRNADGIQTFVIHAK